MECRGNVARHPLQADRRQHATLGIDRREVVRQRDNFVLQPAGLAMLDKRTQDGRTLDQLPLTLAQLIRATQVAFQRRNDALNAT